MLRETYRGPQLADGQVIIPGLALGSEEGWEEAALIYLVGGPQYYQWMVYNDPLWSALSFNLDNDYPVSLANVEPIVNSGNPDIRAFAQGGGKLILYEGWLDPIVPSADTVNYYEAASSYLGSTTQNTARLFMMPGQSHCPTGFDVVSPLVDWVEHGQVPTRIVVTTTSSSGSTSTHPACPWPQTAHYNGSGSTTDAANFTCQ